MSKVHNFNAGPSILPQELIREASEAILDYEGTGLSVLEMSHRSPEIEAVMHEAEELVRELLSLPNNYKVLFLTGGASSQFYMVPLNLLPQMDSASYIDTGRWSHKAIKEAQLYGKVDIAASSRESSYEYIPKEYNIPSSVQYLHITSNNTVAGTQYQAIPDVDCPLVADMSSDIFTEELDIEKYGLIYAGAQKNMGPAGTTLVIVNEDLLGRTERNIPTMLDYRTHIKKESAFNTPPVYAIYVSMLYLRWIKQNGGIPEMKKRSMERAELLYTEIDRNSLFTGKVRKEDRSLMNATFLPIHEEHFQDFLTRSAEAGIVGIKGHRSVGGFRVSLYNAMPIESVEYLVRFMQAYEKENA